MFANLVACWLIGMSAGAVLCFRFGRGALGYLAWVMCWARASRKRATLELAHSNRAHSHSFCSMQAVSKLLDAGRCASA